MPLYEGKRILVASISSGASVNFLTEGNFSSMKKIPDRSILSDVVLSVSFDTQCVIFNIVCNLTHNVKFYTQC